MNVNNIKWAWILTIAGFLAPGAAICNAQVPLPTEEAAAAKILLAEVEHIMEPVRKVVGINTRISMRYLNLAEERRRIMLLRVGDPSYAVAARDNKFQFDSLRELIDRQLFPSRNELRRARQKPSDASLRGPGAELAWMHRWGHLPEWQKLMDVWELSMFADDEASLTIGIGVPPALEPIQSPENANIVRAADQLGQDLIDYGDNVVQHDAKVKAFASAVAAFEQRQRVHVNYAEKCNAAVQRYNMLAPAQQTDDEAARLQDLRNNVERVGVEVAQQHRQLSSQRDALDTAKKALDARRAELSASLQRLHRVESIVPARLSWIALAPVALVQLQSIALEAIVQIPVQRAHPLVGEWNFEGAPKSSFIFDAQGGCAVDAYSTGKLISGTWIITGPNKGTATVIAPDRFVTHTHTYFITVTNGGADVSWTNTSNRGTVTPNSGSTKLERKSRAN